MVVIQSGIENVVRNLKKCQNKTTNKEKMICPPEKKFGEMILSGSVIIIL